MPTYSQIAILISEDTVKYVTCAYDGYPKGVGKTVYDYWKLNGRDSAYVWNILDGYWWTGLAGKDLDLEPIEEDEYRAIRTTLEEENPRLQDEDMLDYYNRITNLIDKTIQDCPRYDEKSNSESITIEGVYPDELREVLQRNVDSGDIQFIYLFVPDTFVTDELRKGRSKNGDLMLMYSQNNKILTEFTA